MALLPQFTMLKSNNGFITMKLKFLIGLFALSTLVSCINYEDVQFNEVKKIEVKNTGAQNVLIDVAVDVDNDARTFVIKEAIIEAVKGDKVYASVSLMEKVKVLKGENENIVLPLRLNLNGGLFGAAAFVMNANGMKYNVLVKVKTSIITRKFEFKGLTSDEVERVIGMDINELIKR